MATLLAKSLASFNESVSLIVQQYERRAEDALAERDETLRLLRTREVEVEQWKQKAAQSENTITHQDDKIAAQADAIAQLRRELTYWRDQASNWQEHFLRVEQQRCTLTSSLHELASDRRAPAPTMPMTPVSRYDEPTPHKTPGKSKPPITALHTKRTATPNAIEPSSTRPVQSKVIRRVQATYEIKAESDDENYLSEPEQPPTTNHQSRSRVIVSEDEEDEEGSDEEEDELCGYDVPQSSPKKNKRTIPSQAQTGPQNAKKRRVAPPKAAARPARKR